MHTKGTSVIVAAGLPISTFRGANEARTTRTEMRHEVSIIVVARDIADAPRCRDDSLDDAISRSKQAIDDGRAKKSTPSELWM